MIINFLNYHTRLTMKIRPRIIPCLLIQNGKLVKTKKFKNPRYLGDPINAVKIYNEKEVDELCILDICATKNGIRPNFELLEEIASEAFMPLSYGGGIDNIEDARRIFKIGYEKIILGNTLYTNNNLIKELIRAFGSQSITAAIDYRYNVFGQAQCYRMSGKKRCKIGVEEMAKYVCDLGVGEILLYSIDNDGKREGYDINMIKKISEIVNIPVVPVGGAGKLSHIKEALEVGKASAVAAGSMFVYWGKKNAVLINYPSEKEFMEEGIYYEK